MCRRAKGEELRASEKKKEIIERETENTATKKFRLSPLPQISTKYGTEKPSVPTLPLGSKI